MNLVRSGKSKLANGFSSKFHQFGKKYSTSNNKPDKLIKKDKQKIKLDYNLYDSFKIWYEELSNYDDGDTISQNKFLKYVLPYYESKELVECKFKKIKAMNVKTPLKMDAYDNTDNQWYINEIRVEKTIDDVSPTNHLVMLHGYGASSGWFYKNYKGIIEESNNVNNLMIHGLDLIGFGLSGRPNVEFKHDSDTKPSLDIETKGIKWGKYSLCLKCGGHLDGKTSRDKHWCYCSDEEEELRKGEFTDSIATTIIKKKELYEYLQNHKELIEEVENVYVESLESWRKENNIEKFDLLAHSLGGYLGMSYILKYPNRINKIIMVSPGGVERSPFAISNPEYKEIKKDDEGELQIPISNEVKSYGFLGRYGLIDENFKLIWRMRCSILTILRWIGPFGPNVLIERNVDKLTRSGNIKDLKEIELFIKYIYSCCIRASFSETTIMRLFDASVVGKYPILDKIRDYGENKLNHKDFLWVYGEHDFMYKQCGVEAIEEIKKVCKDEPGSYELKIIKNAGHNMYLDNDKDFNEEVVRFLGYKKA